MIDAMAFITSRNRRSTSAIRRARCIAMPAWLPTAASSSSSASLNSLAMLAVDVEHAENRVGRAHRRAHHRADPLPHDAFAAAVSLIGQRIIGERRNALLEHVVDDRARQRHLRPTLLPSLRAHRDHVDFVAGRAWRAHQDGGAVAAADFEDRRQDRIKQRFDRAGPRQDVRHLVQRGQVLLRRTRAGAIRPCACRPATGTRAWSDRRRAAPACCCAIRRG